MNQRGQIEIIVIFIILAGLILFSQRLKGEKMISEPEIKKEAPVLKPIPKKPSPAPLPSQPLPQPPSPPSEKIEPPKIKEKDTTPPLRFNPLPTGELPAETRKTTLSLQTNEKAICKYTQVAGLSYDSMQNFFSPPNATSHSAQIGYLSEGEKYIFYLKCEDESGNKNTDDFELSFSVKKPPDKTPPQRSYLLPSGMLHASTTQVELSLLSDERATCYYSTMQEKNFWQGSGSFRSNETGTFHTVLIYNLTFGKIYDYFVRCCDTSGNCNSGDALIRFGIGVSP